MTQHPKLGVKPDALSVVRCRYYHGHYYIEGAPFRISFWTYASGIDANEAQRRLNFANELVAAWNNREAAEAASKAREAALVEALQGLVASVDNLISDSGGVYGLHLNGDPSPWSELTEGGRFEEWLIALEAARAALTKEPDA